MRSEMHEKEKHIGFCMKRIDHATRHVFETHAKALGLDEVTMTNGRFLGYLYYRRGEDVFQKDLENEFHINRSSVATIVKLMEKKGLIIRESMDSDARLKKVSITKLGEEMHLKSMQCIERMEEAIEDTLTESEQEQLLCLLHKIQDGLQNEKNNYQIERNKKERSKPYVE